MPVLTARIPGRNPILPGLLVFLLVFAVELSGPVTVKAEGITLEERVRKIEDEKQIRDLIMAYARLLDAGDFEGFSRLFAENGKWIGLLGGKLKTVQGPEEIHAMMVKAFSGRTYDPDNVSNLHLVSNIKINVEGDRATGFSRWTVLTRNENDEPFVRLSGRYDDIYIREDGRWKFMSRSARRAIP